MNFSPRNLLAAIVAVVIVCSVVFLLLIDSDSEMCEQGNPRFRRSIIDSIGPRDPWGKSSGDINGDGLADLIVGGNSPSKLSLYHNFLKRFRLIKSKNESSELVWYENPNWRKYLISEKYRFGTDQEVADIDRDGHADVVSITNSELIWFRNSDWSPCIIDKRSLHDIEVADFDEDVDLDIVARNQSGFNHNDGNQLHFYRQDSPVRWEHFIVDISHGEGMKIADINRDMRIDVVVNGSWYANPGTLSSDVPWEKNGYGETWQWADVFIDVADVNGDGRSDIILSPAESEGRRYRISWFESPPALNGGWLEHIIDLDVETVHHFIAARDMDNNGCIDIVTAQMHQGKDPDEIVVYWNLSQGMNWDKEVIATTSSHSMRAADIDNDRDIDLFGANWSGDHQDIELWENQTCPKTLTRWRRHVIDSRKPWRSVFIMAADLDRDGYKDLVTGGWWYRNPGNLGGAWDRQLFGDGANNVAVVEDCDGDGDSDILASQWKEPLNWNVYERILKKLRIRSYPPSNGFIWARNDGKGRFEVIRNVASGQGDFLQGAAVVLSKGGANIALSWHESGRGIQLLKVSDDPVHENWKWGCITELSQDEALSAGDIDGDGDQDIILGTKWLRKEDNGKWTIFTLHVSEENPDRNRLADMNNDGKLDVVVGYEAISVLGKVAWYEHDSDPTKLWNEHSVASAIGPMSLDVSDLDGDVDLDIVVGEHNLKDPQSSRLLVLENIDGLGHEWLEHVIHTGDEHHDGAQLVDIDNDGDLDIISIGWGHDRALLYENMHANGRYRTISLG